MFSLAGLASLGCLTVTLTVMIVLVSMSPAAADVVAEVQVKPLQDVIDNLRDVIVGLLVSIATLFLTIGGVRYMMAGGDPGQLERAKGAFRNAGIGYSLAALAPVLLEILKQVVGQ